MFYAPSKLLVPYLQLAVFFPSPRTCSSWPFSLVNYLHVKQWIKMMGLRKMLLILKEQNHIYSWNLLPEAFTVGLCVLSSSALRVLRRRGTPFSHSWFICRGKCLSASDFQTSPQHLGMGWEDVSLTSSPDWETMEECKKKKKKVCRKAQVATEIPKWGRYQQD